MDVTVLDQLEQPFLGMREVVRVDALTDFFGRAFTATAAELGAQGLAPVGPPVALYTGEVGETTDVTAGFPTTEPPTPGGGLVAAVLPAGRAAVTVHHGPYDAMVTTYSGLMGWFEEQGLTPGPTMWEEYLVGPDSVADPAEWRTRIVWPVA